MVIIGFRQEQGESFWAYGEGHVLISPFRNTAFFKIKPKGQNERGNDPLQGKMVSF